MKKKIHPELMETVIKCACGATYTTFSVKESIHVDICSACHPFFTGKQKLVDTAGRVEKFKKRLSRKEPPSMNKTKKKKSVRKTKTSK